MTLTCTRLLFVGAFCALTSATSAAASELGHSSGAVERDDDGHTDGPVDLPRETGGAGIINGGAATRDEHPQTGALLFAGTSWSGSASSPVQAFVCSSTLIAPDVVLTAAHCIDPVSIVAGRGELVDTTFVWSREPDLTAYDGSRVNLPWPDDGGTRLFLLSGALSTAHLEVG